MLLSVLQKENEQVPVEDANEQVPVQEENEVGTVEEANEQVPVQDNIEVVPVQEEVPVNEDHEYDTNVESDDSVEVVEIIQKDKGKGKVSERKKGKVAERKKGKLADKGRGKVADKGRGKVADKVKRKISDAGGSKRKRKQEKVVDSSETESDDLGFDGLGNDGSDSDSDDSLYVPLVDEARSWSMDDDNQSYASEDLHSPVSTDDEGRSGLRPTFPQHDEVAGFGNVRLEVGMEFRDLKSFKKAVRDYTIEVGREIKMVKNDKERVTYKCKGEICKWRIYCAWSNLQKSFQIKTFEDDHQCSRSFRNKAASSNWVASKLERQLRTQPNMNHSEAFDFIKKEYKVHLCDSKLFRSMKKARKLVEGNEAEQYAKLWDYAYELLKSNPGSTVKMDTIAISDTETQFQRIYVCLEACKKGFKAGCRPLIGLDGVF